MPIVIYYYPDIYRPKIITIFGFNPNEACTCSNAMFVMVLDGTCHKTYNRRSLGNEL